VEVLEGALDLLQDVVLAVVNQHKPRHHLVQIVQRDRADNLAPIDQQIVAYLAVLRSSHLTSFTSFSLSCSISFSPSSPPLLLTCYLISH